MRYHHRTIDNVLVAIDAEGHVGVVEKRWDFVVLTLGRVFKIGGSPHAWGVSPGPDIRVDDPNARFRTQGEAISALLKHTAWTVA